MISILIYSKSNVDNIIALVDAFGKYQVTAQIQHFEVLGTIIEDSLPDILIVNTNISEFETLKDILVKLKTRILLIASDFEPDNIYSAFRFGVFGFIDTPITPFNLYEALNNLSNDLFFLTPQGTKNLIQSFKLTGNNLLTKKERRILELMKGGMTYTMIAEELFLSGNTIRSHMQNIYSKLNATCKAQAIQIATECRII